MECFSFSTDFSRQLSTSSFSLPNRFLWAALEEVNITDSRAVVEVVVKTGGYNTVEPISEPFLTAVEPASPQFVVPAPVLDRSNVLGLRDFTMPPRPVAFIGDTATADTVRGRDVRELGSLGLI